MSMNDDGYSPEETEGVTLGNDLGQLMAETPYVTNGRVDPTYQSGVSQYTAPVAERRSFWSRFWWIIPLALLLIVLPLLLQRCAPAYPIAVESLPSLFPMNAFHFIQ